MSYLPSVMATATMLHVIVSVEPCLGVEYQDQLLSILGINKVCSLSLSFTLRPVFPYVHHWLLEILSILKSVNNLLCVVKQDKVEECYRLISEVASAYHFHSSNKRKFRSVPGSPKGVMDLSFSSESSSNDSWSVAGASVSSSPEPLTKKSRAQAGQKEDQQQQHAQEQELDHATASDSTPG